MKIQPIAWSSIQPETMSPLLTRRYISGEDFSFLILHFCF